MKRTLNKLLVLLLLSIALFVLAVFSRISFSAPSVVTSDTLVPTATFVVGKSYVAVTFPMPVFGDSSLATVKSSNFSITDGNAAGMASVTDNFVAADSARSFRIVANKASVAGDTADTLTIKDIYTVGGMALPDYTFNLVSGDAAPTVTEINAEAGKGYVMVRFSEPVVNNVGTIITSSDITYTEGGVAGNVASAGAIYIDPNNNQEFMAIGSPGAAWNADDIAGDSITLKDNAFYDLAGNELASPFIGAHNPGDAIALSDAVVTTDSTAPTLLNVYGEYDSDSILLEFSEPVATGSNGAGAIGPSDFTVGGGLASITSFSGGTFGGTAHFATVNDDLSVTTTVDVADSTSVYDLFGNALVSGSPKTVKDVVAPAIRGVWINQYINHMEYQSGDGEYTAASGTAARASTDFEVNEGAHATSWTLATVTNSGSEGLIMSEPSILPIYDLSELSLEFSQLKFDILFMPDDEDYGKSLNSTAVDDILIAFNNDFLGEFPSLTSSVFDIPGPIPAGVYTEITIDLTATVDSGTALSAQEADVDEWGVFIGSSNDTFVNDDEFIIDNARFSRGSNSSKNQIIIEYTEDITHANLPSVGASTASTSSIADIITNKVIAGLGSFSTGTFTTKAGTNTITHAGNVLIIDLADRAGGIVTQGSPVSLSGTFTPNTAVTDNSVGAAANAIEATSTHIVETPLDTFDLTSSVTAITNFTVNTTAPGTASFGWDPPTQASTFSHYAVVYGTSAGVTTANTIYDETDDVLLATATTNMIEIAGLTDTTEYFFTLVAVDQKGNYTTLAGERAFTPSGVTSSFSDSTAPDLPTDFTCMVSEDFKVTLTWVDPTAGDLEGVYVLKGGEVVATVAPGVLTYVDEDVVEGDVVTYKFKAFDDSGNVSGETAKAALTVEFTGEEIVVEDPVELEDPEIPVEEPVVPVEELVFSDVSEHWAKDFILTLFFDGLVQGLPDGTFAPNQPVTRAEILKIALGAFDRELTNPLTYAGPISYSDVEMNTWYSKYIIAGTEQGIVSGYGDGTFRPDLFVTRAEALKIILNASEQEVVATTLLDFVDVVAGDWFYNFVSYAVGIDIVNGYDDNTFRPHANITRAEAAKIVEMMR